MRALLLDSRADAPLTLARSVQNIVQWFGAMQAQDHASGLWSLGLRIPGSTEADVLAAIERKEALRTWPMRGTVHLVPPRDAKWMLELMGVRPLAGSAKRRELLGLTEAVVELAVDTLRSSLSGDKRLTRAECIGELNEAGIATASQVGYHLLWYASQKGVTCIGPYQGKEQTFVLLDEYVPDAHRPQREEALGIVALRYVRGHGPVTVTELARWTGLGMRDSRAGIAAAGASITQVDTDDGPMLVAVEALEDTSAVAAGQFTLPGFDEYMLGYGDRSLILDPAGFQEVVPGNNGVFRATLVRSGHVVGTWKRTLRAKSCVVDAVPLGSGQGKRISATDRAGFDAAFGPYGAFVGKPVEVRWA